MHQYKELNIVISSGTPEKRFTFLLKENHILLEIIGGQYRKPELI